MNKKNSKILDIAMYVPEKILSNEELGEIYDDWPAEKILNKTGIRERHIANENQTAGDLAYNAAIKLFEQGNIKAKEIDFIILCTQAPDHVLPTTACILQNRLGIPRQAGALDINLGCSGFVYGLSLAKGLIETGAANCVLFLTADTYSKYIHPRDKSVRTLFGDGAAATVIVGSDSDDSSIGPFVFGTDGSGAEMLIVEAGMFRQRKSSETSVEHTDFSGNIRTKENLYMNGAEVMNFSLNEVPKSVIDLLSKAGKTKEDIDFFILHQANKFMLDALRKKINVSSNKLPLVIEKFGNTVSSSIPIAIHELINEGRLKKGHKLVLVGFGVGFSWAACMLNF
jgi:3-oxoacyl-[acyl-carrier-protein] synthase-3